MVGRLNSSFNPLVGDTIGSPSSATWLACPIEKVINHSSILSVKYNSISCGGRLEKCMEVLLKKLPAAVASSCGNNHLENKNRPSNIPATCLPTPNPWWRLLKWQTLRLLGLTYGHHGCFPSADPSRYQTNYTRHAMSSCKMLSSTLRFRSFYMYNIWMIYIYMYIL